MDRADLAALKRAVEQVEAAVPVLRRHVEQLEGATAIGTSPRPAPVVSKDLDGQLWIDQRLFRVSRTGTRKVQLEIARGKSGQDNWRLAVRGDVSDGEALMPVVDPRDPRRWLSEGDDLPDELADFHVRPAYQVMDQPTARTLRAVIPLDDEMALARFAAWAARVRGLI